MENGIILFYVFEEVDTRGGYHDEICVLLMK